MPMKNTFLRIFLDKEQPSRSPQKASQARSCWCRSAMLKCTLSQVCWTSFADFFFKKKTKENNFISTLGSSSSQQAQIIRNNLHLCECLSHKLLTLSFLSSKTMSHIRQRRREHISAAHSYRKDFSSRISIASTSKLWIGPSHFVERE